MSTPINRRSFLAATAGAAALAAAGTTAARAQPARPKKSLMYTMLPNTLSREDRFKLARDVGFEGIEAPPITDMAECEAMRSGAEKAGIPIHCVIYGGWDPPLSHPDPEKRELSRGKAEAAIRGARAMGADAILIVPAVVNAETPYRMAWKHSHEQVKKLIPVAQKEKVRICLEEVWNNFLLSPLEFTEYVDSFKSPWVQAYFDIGNVVTFGWPEHWIRELGKRIVRVHLKDYKGGPGLFGGNKGSFVNLREGSVNWPEVMKALNEVGFTSYMTCELRGGDEAYLRDLSQRVDLILAGK